MLKSAFSAFLHPKPSTLNPAQVFGGGSASDVCMGTRILLVPLSRGIWSVIVGVWDTMEGRRGSR